MAEKIVFLTGHIAEEPLRKVLQSMDGQCDFVWQVHNIGVHVAALMTPNIIRRRLSLQPLDDDVVRIIVPGRVHGDIEALSSYFSVSVERGPDDLRELPHHFGLGSEPVDLSSHDCLIFAEITDAPYLDVETLLVRAQDLAQQGADIIDVGCLPEVPFTHLETTIEALHKRGFKVSVDSSNEDELRRAARVGVDYMLSLHEGNVTLLDDYPHTVPILVPRVRGNMGSLYRAIEAYQKKGRAFYADPILDPLHAGFSESLSRYIRLRQRYPDIKVLMGTANVTELCDSDSSGVVMVLMGLVSELHIEAVLTVQVSDHCRRVVAESDRARRLFAYARRQRTLVSGIDDGLTVVHERKPLWDEPQALIATQKKIRDKAWRIAVSEQQGLHVYNGEKHLQGWDPFALFEQLGLQQDGAHAFYMGYELAKAELARRLGKRYVQDQPLHWGISTLPRPTQDKNDEDN